MSYWTIMALPLFGALMGYWVGLAVTWFGGHGHNHD